MKRILVALLSGALLGLAPLSLPAQAAAPAGDKQADESWSRATQRSARAITVQTKVQFDPQAAPKAYHGSGVTLAGRVWGYDTSEGQWEYLSWGTVTLQRRWQGSSAWQTLGTQDLAAMAGSFSFVPRAERNAIYQVRYSGYSAGEYVFSPSAVTHTLGVVRRFNESITKRTLIFRGRIAPSYARKVVVIERRTCASCSWKRYAKIRTDRRSRWSKKLTAPRALGQRYYFRAVVAGNKQYVKSFSRTAETFRRR